MGETLAETRVEVQARRAELERSAEELRGRLRRMLDVKARFRENPALFIGVGAGAVFLVAGGPVRVARLVRRRLRPSTTEQAYDALPKPMQDWVDALAAGVGPKAERARQNLAEEIQRWRHEPIKSKKARKELAKAIVEGPPGPSRAGWKAAEAGLTLLSAALARRAIEAFVTGERPIRASAPASTSAAAPKGPPDRPQEAAEEYSGFSSRAR